MQQPQSADDVQGAGKPEELSAWVCVSKSTKAWIAERLSDVLQARAAKILQGYGAQRYVDHHFPILAMHWRNDINEVLLVDPYGHDLRDLKRAFCMSYADCKRVLRLVRMYQHQWRTVVFPRIYHRRRQAEARQLLLCLARLQIKDHNFVRDEVLRCLLVRCA